MSATHSKRRSIVTSILLFLIVFGLWQAYDLALNYVSLPSLLITILSYFAIYAASLMILVLFVKFGKSSFKEHGFKEPAHVQKNILLSVAFTLIYIIIMLMPGFLFGFISRSFPEFFSIVLNISRAILIAVTTEFIFRGYIFRNLTRNHGFFISLYASSIMFSLHTYESPISIMSLLTMNANEIITDILFQQIAAVFAAGLFLGFLFYKMDWSLLGPIIFRIGTLLSFYFMPLVAKSPWWMGLTFEVMAYVGLIVIVASVIKEPLYRRRRYGLE